MTSDFDRDLSYSSEEKIAGEDLDGFELLSAYLDNELTPAERKEVQRRLDEQPEFQKMYARLSHLQSQIQHLTAPTSDLSTEDLSHKVFQKIDSRQRRRKVAVWGGGAIAAALIAFVSSIIPSDSAFKFAKSPTESSIMLAVAVDKPAVKIPKAAVANSQENPQN